MVLNHFFSASEVNRVAKPKQTWHSDLVELGSTCSGADYSPPRSGGWNVTPLTEYHGEEKSTTFIVPADVCCRSDQKSREI